MPKGPCEGKHSFLTTSCVRDENWLFWLCRQLLLTIQLRQKGSQEYSRQQRGFYFGLLMHYSMWRDMTALPIYLQFIRSKGINLSDFISNFSTSKFLAKYEVTFGQYFSFMGIVVNVIQNKLYCLVGKRVAIIVYWWTNLSILKNKKTNLFNLSTFTFIFLANTTILFNIISKLWYDTYNSKMMSWLQKPIFFCFLCTNINCFLLKKWMSVVHSLNCV